ncbi:MAG: 2,3-bisphosphoglycerate-independent phosphoglycerate mutase [Promethearchaeota archaeon]
MPEERMPFMKLEKFPGFEPREGPLLLVILDGWGVGKHDEGDAIYRAATPNLDALRKICKERNLYTTLKAHGVAVGMPTDKDMGNSEVAHNTMGAGRAFAQGAKLVNEAIESGRVFQTDLWRELVEPVRDGGATFHLIGLLSDGNVHSHIDQLFGLVDHLAAEGAKRVRLHALLDGRDVPARSALKYFDMVEDKFGKINATPGLDYRIASGGGRMHVTMDRYNSDWEVVKRGWDAHVRGIPEKSDNYPGYFKSAREAVETARVVDPAVDDQYNPSFVIVDDGGEPVGRMRDGDSVVFFNFRGDRAIQISRAFEDDDFDGFDRVERPRVNYAGMLEYDGDMHIPKQFLVPPPRITEILAQYLCGMGVKSFAIAETHKYGHVTYFWNGNFLGYVCPGLEEYVEVKSDHTEMIATHPEMKACEVTIRLIDALDSGKYDFLRVNIANGDMVGHTGVMDAAIRSAEVVDECVGKLVEAITRLGGLMVLTADHGNSDEMLNPDGTPKTSHTLNPVPFMVHDPAYAGEYEVDDGLDTPTIASIAATVLNFLGFKKPAEYDPGVLKFGKSP